MPSRFEHPIAVLLLSLMLLGVAQQLTGILSHCKVPSFFSSKQSVKRLRHHNKGRKERLTLLSYLASTFSALSHLIHNTPFHSID